MSDFDSGFWSLFVAGVTLVSIAGCGWLLASLSRRKVATDPDKTGHVWDEDLDELNNPLPMWWIWLFWITIAFSLAYLWYYPGLGSFKGSSNWTSAGEYEAEVKAAQAQHGLYYYYQVMAKALHAYGQPVITDAQGTPHDWRLELIDKLAALQQPDGSWAGEKRWMEDNPVLVTSYVVMALQEVQKDLKQFPVERARDGGER